MKKWLKPISFTAGGALMGLIYDSFAGCSTGTCPLTANPLSTAAYMGFAGRLLSGRNETAHARRRSLSGGGYSVNS